METLDFQAFLRFDNKICTHKLEFDDDRIRFQLGAHFPNFLNAKIIHKRVTYGNILLLCATRLKTRFNDPFKSLPTDAARFGLHDVYEYLRIWYSKIHARTHANRPGTFARRGERQGPGRVSGSSAPPPPRLHTICAITLWTHVCTRAHTGVHIGCPPSIGPSTSPSSTTRWWNVPGQD